MRNPELQSKIDDIWLTSDDEFVPDFISCENKSHLQTNKSFIVPLTIDGKIIPTTGCITQIVEYHPGSGKFSLEWIRIPTGSFPISAKCKLTTERRVSIYSFTGYRNRFGHPERLSKNKRKAALALLNPLSPWYGNMSGAFSSVYPYWKTVAKKKWNTVHIMARGFFDRPWFYKLIREDRLMSMLVNDIKSELTKRGVDNKHLANILIEAEETAREKGDVKALLIVFDKMKDILDKDTNSAGAVVPDENRIIGQLTAPVVPMSFPSENPQVKTQSVYISKEKFDKLKNQHDVSDSIIQEANADFEDIDDDEAISIVEKIIEKEAE